MGIKECDSIATYEELVRKRFKYNFEVEPIMQDCSSINPVANSDELFNSEDDLLSIASLEYMKYLDKTKDDEPTFDTFDEEEDNTSNALGPQTTECITQTNTSKKRIYLCKFNPKKN